jgi:hypothetical protein
MFALPNGADRDCLLPVQASGDGASPHASTMRAAPSLRIGLVVALAIVAFHIMPFAGKFAAYVATGRFLESDFQSFYYAADAAFNRGLSPYSLDVVRGYERAMGGVVYPFLYPPTALPWFWPLSLFDFTTAVLLFQAVSVASLFALLLLLWRNVVQRIEGAAWALILLGALFVFQGISETLDWAQINLIVVLLIVTAWLRAADPTADRGVAFCLFAAGALKTYPLLFLLVPLLRRRFGVIGWFAVFAAADLLLSLLILPASVWRDWLVNIAPTGGYGAMPFGLFSATTAGNQNFNGLFLRLLGEGETARLCATVAALVCGAATVLAVFLLREVDDERSLWTLLRADLGAHLPRRAALLDASHRVPRSRPRLGRTAGQSHRHKDGPGGAGHAAGGARPLRLSVADQGAGRAVQSMAPLGAAGRARPAVRAAARPGRGHGAARCDRRPRPRGGAIRLRPERQIGHPRCFSATTKRGA